MEAKLEAYRRQKRREIWIQNFKLKLRKMIPFLDSSEKDEKKTVIDIDPVNNYTNQQSNEIPKRKELERIVESSSDPEEEEEPVIEQISEKDQRIRYLLYGLYFVFWVTCYCIAIELQFGVVFLILSAIFGIYFNTRTGPKKKNEISAYSVFNKNQEAIDGTLKAEQFEREIRYGSMSVR